MNRRFKKQIQELQGHRDVLDSMSFPTGRYKAASTGRVSADRAEAGPRCAGGLVLATARPCGVGRGPLRPALCLAPPRAALPGGLGPTAGGINPEFVRNFR